MTNPLRLISAAAAGIAIAVAIPAGPARVRAQTTDPGPYNPGYPPLPDWDEINRPAHRGFHARASAGPALARVTWLDVAQPNSFSGFAAALSLAAGATVVDDLLLFGEVAVSSAMAPRIGGFDPDRFPEKTALTTLGFGGGLAYYFMPSNVSVSAAVLLTQIRTVDRQRDQLLARTNLGPAFHMGAGKDWPLTDHWSLGLSIRAHTALLQDHAGETAPAWRSYGLGLSLSALYNN